MTPIEDHPLRYKLANELHARPFPTMDAPCTVAYLAIKEPEMAASRDRARDMEHLTALLDRHGVAHPPPGATHYYGQIGRHWLKWEQHTEFVAYTVFSQGLGERAFDATEFDPFPGDWLAASPGERVTSILLRVEPRPANDDQMDTKLRAWFVPESLAVSQMLDDAVVSAGDFRIDNHGHMRFAIFVSKATGPQRIGRVVQRLCEIETYKSMSMLGFSRIKRMEPTLSTLDTGLTAVVADMSQGDRAEDTLKALLQISAELETMSAQASFRFGATGAYRAIVGERIQALREERWRGRQTFAEFMMRRYEPAMRTVTSSERRLEAMSARAVRAANLLQTRVDVERSAQNQMLLESMDRRSDLQLKLQRTVEGLSVVAISYYAVNLALYFLYPLGAGFGMSKAGLAAVLTPLTVGVVWWMIRRIHKKMH